MLIVVTNMNRVGPALGDPIIGCGATAHGGHMQIQLSRMASVVDSRRSVGTAFEVEEQWGKSTGHILLHTRHMTDSESLYTIQK
jgi:hypothetical protein